MSYTLEDFKADHDLDQKTIDERKEQLLEEMRLYELKEARKTAGRDPEAARRTHGRQPGSGSAASKSGERRQDRNPYAAPLSRRHRRQASGQRDHAGRAHPATGLRSGNPSCHRLPPQIRFPRLHPRLVVDAMPAGQTVDDVFQFGDEAGYRTRTVILDEGLIAGDAGQAACRVRPMRTRRRKPNARRPNTTGKVTNPAAYPIQNMLIASRSG